MTDYAEFVVEAQDSLDRLRDLCREMVDLETRIEEQERVLKETKKLRDSLAMKEIPEIMREKGIDRLDLDDVTITYDQSLFARPSKGNMPAAVAWLRDHGHDAIIKNEVVVPFGPGQDELAQALLRKVLDEYPDATEKTTVHPSTLSALLRELRESGKVVPLEVFGAYERREAKIKKKKNQ